MVFIPRLVDCFISQDLDQIVLNIDAPWDGMTMKITSINIVGNIDCDIHTAIQLPNSGLTSSSFTQFAT
jgi:hypothetical protein